LVEKIIDAQNLLLARGAHKLAGAGLATTVHDDENAAKNAAFLNRSPESTAEMAHKAARESAEIAKAAREALDARNDKAKVAPPTATDKAVSAGTKAGEKIVKGLSDPAAPAKVDRKELSAAAKWFKANGASMSPEKRAQFRERYGF
jgi:hypothetical protein